MKNICRSLVLPLGMALLLVHASVFAGAPVLNTFVPEMAQKALPDGAPETAQKALPKSSGIFSREARVHANPAFLVPRDGQSTTSADIQLFDGMTVTVVSQEIKQISPGLWHWMGSVRGYPGSVVDFGITETTIFGGIALGRRDLPNSGEFSIDVGRDGYGYLRERKPRPLHSSQNSTNAAAMPRFSVATMTNVAKDYPACAPAAGPDSIIDIAVLYTPEAQIATTNIESQIAVAVDQINNALLTSRVMPLVTTDGGLTCQPLQLQVRLARTEIANFSEGTGVTRYQALDWLSGVALSANFPYPQNMQSPWLRYNYAADVVALVTSRLSDLGGTACGRTTETDAPDSAKAFTVISLECLSPPEYVFAHEFAHLLGARHDPAEAVREGDLGGASYAHGYIDEDHSFSTLMAYPQCAWPYSCPRRLVYSNPDVLIEYDPLGYPGLTASIGTSTQYPGTSLTSNNAEIMRENSSGVANYKTASSSCTYSDNQFLSQSTTIDGLGGSATVNVSIKKLCAGVLADVSPPPTSLDDWLGVLWATYGDASQSITFSASPNWGAYGTSRSGSIAAGRTLITASQPTGCTFSLTESSITFNADGGGGTAVAVVPNAACPLTPVSGANWLVVDSEMPAGLARMLYYHVMPNTGPPRIANLLLGGQTFIVSQTDGCSGALTAKSRVLSTKKGKNSAQAKASADDICAAPPAATLVPTSLNFGVQGVTSASEPLSATLTNTGVTRWCFRPSRSTTHRS